jgi:hypothetical protein
MSVTPRGHTAGLHGGLGSHPFSADGVYPRQNVFSTFGSHPGVVDTGGTSIQKMFGEMVTPHSAPVGVGSMYQIGHETHSLLTSGTPESLGTFIIQNTFDASQHPHFKILVPRLATGNAMRGVSVAIVKFGPQLPSEVPEGTTGRGLTHTVEELGSKHRRIGQGFRISEDAALIPEGKNLIAKYLEGISTNMLITAHGMITTSLLRVNNEFRAQRNSLFEPGSLAGDQFSKKIFSEIAPFHRGKESIYKAVDLIKRMGKSAHAPPFKYCLTSENAIRVMACSDPHISSYATFGPEGNEIYKRPVDHFQSGNPDLGIQFCPEPEHSFANNGREGVIGNNLLSREIVTGRHYVLDFDTMISKKQGVPIKSSAALAYLNIERGKGGSVEVHDYLTLLDNCTLFEKDGDGMHPIYNEAVRDQGKKMLDLCQELRIRTSTGNGARVDPWINWLPAKVPFVVEYIGGQDLYYTSEDTHRTIVGMAMKTITEGFSTEEMNDMYRVLQFASQNVTSNNHKYNLHFLAGVIMSNTPGVFTEGIPLPPFVVYKDEEFYLGTAPDKYLEFATDDQGVFQIGGYLQESMLTYNKVTADGLFHYRIRVEKNILPFFGSIEILRHFMDSPDKRGWENYFRPDFLEGLARGLNVLDEVTHRLQTIFNSVSAPNLFVSDLHGRGGRNNGHMLQQRLFLGGNVDTISVTPGHFETLHGDNIGQVSRTGPPPLDPGGASYLTSGVIPPPNSGNADGHNTTFRNGFLCASGSMMDELTKYGQFPQSGETVVNSTVGAFTSVATYVGAHNVPNVNALGRYREQSSKSSIRNNSLFSLNPPNIADYPSTFAPIADNPFMDARLKFFENSMSLSGVMKVVQTAVNTMYCGARVNKGIFRQMFNAGILPPLTFLVVDMDFRVKTHAMIYASDNIGTLNYFLPHVSVAKDGDHKMRNYNYTVHMGTLIMDRRGVYVHSDATFAGYVSGGKGDVYIVNGPGASGTSGVQTLYANHNDLDFNPITGFKRGSRVCLPMGGSRRRSDMADIVLLAGPVTFEPLGLLPWIPQDVLSSNNKSQNQPMTHDSGILTLLNFQFHKMFKSNVAMSTNANANASHYEETAAAKTNAFLSGHGDQWAFNPETSQFNYQIVTGSAPLGSIPVGGREVLDGGCTTMEAVALKNKDRTTSLN